LTAFGAAFAKTSASGSISDYIYRYQSGDQRAASQAVLGQGDIGFWIDGWTGGETQLTAHVTLPCQNAARAVITGEATSTFVYRGGAVVLTGASRVFATRAMAAADMRATYQLNYTSCILRSVSANAGPGVQVLSVTPNQLPEIGQRTVGTRLLLSTAMNGKRIRLVVDLDETYKGRVESSVTLTQRYSGAQSTTSMHTAEIRYLHQIAQRIAP